MAESTEPPAEGQPRSGESPVPYGEGEHLSDEEINGLLGNGSGNGGSPAAFGEEGKTKIPPSILIVTRDEDQIQMLRGALQNYGFEVIPVRNPFSALDQLRLREYGGVVTDFELWAEKGRLLFARIETGGNPLPVVFLCEGPDSLTAARTTQAAAVIQRPLQPVDLARVGRIFVRPAGLTDPGSLPERRSSLPPPLPASQEGADRKGPTPAAGEASRPLEPGTPPVRATGAVPQAGELLWLRFFFEARMAIRSAEPGRKRVEAILACFQREVGPFPCGVGIAFDESWLILGLPGSQMILTRIGLALAKGPPHSGGTVFLREPRSQPGESPSRELVAWWSTKGRPSVFLAHFAPDLGGAFGKEALIPVKYLREIPILFQEVGTLDRL